MAKQIRYNSDFCETVLQTKGSNVNNDKFLSNNKSQTHAQHNCCITKKNKGKYYPINKRGVLKMLKICGKYLILYACIAQNCWTSALCAKTNEQ